MLTIESNDDGTIEVWQFDVSTKHSMRVRTQPDKLATTLPRDVLVMARKLVNELDRVLPKEPIHTLLWVSDKPVNDDSTALADGEPSSVAAGRLEHV
jgi:hypothetical protein